MNTVHQSSKTTASASASATTKKRKQPPSSKSNHSATVSATTGICEHVSDRYEKVGRIGQGTYGIVYKARDKKTSTFVALKRCIPHHESSDGFPITTLREIQTLRMAKGHPNIVQLLEVAVSSTNGVFLVFEYCSHDLAQILDSHYAKRRSSPFSEPHVKTLAYQLLAALDFLHARATLHRDIKPSNLLYHQGRLQLADFGLARQQQPQQQRLTPNVVSLWYRAPELLWKTKAFANYTTAIDMWATGCVIAELLQGFPLLDAKTELEQMENMVACLGAPPSCYGERLTVKTRGIHNQPKKGMELWDRFEYLSKEGLELLTTLLEYNPDRRWTAHQAMSSPFFTVDPLPASIMPTFPSLQEGNL